MHIIDKTQKHLFFMKRMILLLLTVFSSGCLFAQSIAIKNNLLYDITATPNLGLEVGLSKHLSLDLTAGYHPWTLGDDKSLEHWQVQPELRYWLFERFDSHFFGLHGQYMDYDFLGFDLPWGMKKEHGYDGTSWGAGISYGYQLYLGPRWNMEFTIGGGYSNFKYTKYAINADGEKIDADQFKRNYYGFTKLGISIVYIIK